MARGWLVSTRPQLHEAAGRSPHLTSYRSIPTLIRSRCPSRDRPSPGNGLRRNHRRTGCTGPANHPDTRSRHDGDHCVVATPISVARDTSSKLCANRVRKHHPPANPPRSGTGSIAGCPRHHRGLPRPSPSTSLGYLACTIHEDSLRTREDATQRSYSRASRLKTYSCSPSKG